VLLTYCDLLSCWSCETGLDSVEIGIERADEADVALFRRTPVANRDGAVAGARPCACVVVSHVTRHAQCPRHAANQEPSPVTGRCSVESDGPIELVKRFILFFDPHDAVLLRHLL